MAKTSKKRIPVAYKVRLRTSKNWAWSTWEIYAPSPKKIREAYPKAEIKWMKPFAWIEK